MGQFQRVAVCALLTSSLLADGLLAEDLSPFGYGGEASVAVSAKESPQKPHEAAAYSPSEVERRIEETLNQRLRAPIEAVAQPLNILMTQISEDYDIPIVFDAAALEDAAISPDVEVSLGPLRNISLRSVLELLLRSAGDALTYVIENEVLLITTYEEAEQRLDVEVYRVDDLVAPEWAAQGSDGEFDSLIDLIVATVESDSWMDNGTGEGEIRTFAPGMIVISQTHHVQRQVHELLDNLRSTKVAIEAERAAVLEGSADRPVTRAINLHNEEITSPKNRARLESALQASVDWNAGGEASEEDVFLYVFKNHVLVRHSPTVVRQVEQVVRQINSVSQPDGAISGGRGEERREGQRGGGYGGRGRGVF